MSLALACLLASFSIAPAALPIASASPGLSPGLSRATSPQASGWCENKRFGFKLKPPAKFQEVPLKLDENWIGAKFLSEKFDIWIDPDTRYDYEFKPTLTVIGFLEREKETDFFDEDGKSGLDVDVEETGDGEDEPKSVTIKTKAYEDYEDFLDRTYSGGGFFVASKEEGQHGKLPVTKFEIKVEKLAYDGPKRISTWVFHCEGVDVAVQFEVLEETREKYDRDLTRTFKSFKAIEREVDASLDQSGARFITLRQMTSGTPEERRAMRKASEAQLREQAAASVTDGWTAEAVSDCFVINHTDSRYAKKVVDRCEGVMQWLDDTFPFIGPDEYVRGPIIRICDSYEEENAYRKGGDGWWSTGLEIVTHDNKDSWTDWEAQWTNRQIFFHWFRERDIELYAAMPAWLRDGLGTFVEDLRVKGKKVSARGDDWDRDWLRKDLRDGKASQPRDIMRRAKANNSNWSTQSREAGALVRYLMSPAAAKNKQSRDVLPRYMQNLKLALEEIDAKEEQPEKSSEPKTEAEEEKLFQERQKRWQEREQELVEDVWFRTFKSWSDKDWDKFERYYFDSID